MLCIEKCKLQIAFIEISWLSNLLTWIMKSKYTGTPTHEWNKGSDVPCTLLSSQLTASYNNDKLVYSDLGSINQAASRLQPLKAVNMLINSTVHKTDSSFCINSSWQLKHTDHSFWCTLITHSELTSITQLQLFILSVSASSCLIKLFTRVSIQSWLHQSNSAEWKCVHL